MSLDEVWQCLPHLTVPSELAPACAMYLVVRLIKASAVHVLGAKL
jgi:hypothetical protein